MRNSPKVGDTINAKTEPANATGTLTYQWLADGTPIDVPSAASLTVTADMVGKKISVKVTGDNESTATSAETAAVEAPATEKIQILSATQKSGTEIELKFNKAVSSAAYTFAVTRGTTAQTVTESISEDGLTAILTLGAKMGAADYLITVTNKEDATDAAEYTLTAEVVTLAELQFQGENLIQLTADGTSAAVVLKGADQFGGEVILTSSNLQLYSSVSTDVTYDNNTSRVIVSVEATSASLLAVGQTVTVTAMYNNGTNYIQKAQALTVAARGYVAEMTFGDLATTKTTLKDARVTLDNFASNTYYIPITSAKDQYNNPLTATQLNEMAGSGAGGNLLFLVPSSSMGSYYAYTDADDPFSTLADGTIALGLKKGTLNKPGTFSVSATSVGGGAFTTDVTLEDNPWIDQLSVSVPELYNGVTAEVTVTATDQYGDPFDLYENFGKGYAADHANTATHVNLGDLNNMTTNGSSIEVTKGTLSYTKDTNNKAVKLTYKRTLDTATTAETVVFTSTTAKPFVNTLTMTVNTSGYAAGIKGLKSGINTNLVAGATINFKDRKDVIQFLDSYGAVMSFGDAAVPKYVDSAAAVPTTTEMATAAGTSGELNTLVTVTGTPSAWSDYVPTGYNSAFFTVSTSGVAGNLSSGTYTANPGSGTGQENAATITVTLYPVKYTTAGGYAWDTAVKKAFSVTAQAASDLSYSVSVKDAKTLHVGKADALVTNPSVTIVLSASDKTGSEVALPTGTYMTSVKTKKGLVGEAEDTTKHTSAIKYDGSLEITGSGTDTEVL